MDRKEIFMLSLCSVVYFAVAAEQECIGLQQSDERGTGCGRYGSICMQLYITSVRSRLLFTQTSCLTFIKVF